MISAAPLRSYDSKVALMDTVGKLLSYTWTMGVLLLCKLVHYMQNVSAICTVLTLTAISVDTCPLNAERFGHLLRADSDCHQRGQLRQSKPLVAKLLSYPWNMGVLLCKLVHYMQNVSAICSVLTLTAISVAKLFSYTWTMGVLLCKLVHYMQNVSAICSVLTLTAISVERYYAIVHPMKAKYICTISQAKKIILATWVASVILALPNLVIQTKYICTISQAKKIILATWVASVILALPNLVIQAKYIYTISQAKKITLATWVASVILALPNLVIQAKKIILATWVASVILALPNLVIQAKKIILATWVASVILALPNLVIQ
ncbi:hypothetical protein J6590_095725, partial [Homalodisca vitripennis]